MNRKVYEEQRFYEEKVRNAVTAKEAARAVWEASGLLEPRYSGGTIMLRGAVCGRTVAVVPSAAEFRRQLELLKKSSECYEP